MDGGNLAPVRIFKIVQFQRYVGVGIQYTGWCQAFPFTCRGSSNRNIISNSITSTHTHSRTDSASEFLKITPIQSGAGTFVPPYTPHRLRFRV